jgi:DNA polymerase III subunit epsilon
LGIIIVIAIAVLAVIILLVTHQTLNPSSDFQPESLTPGIGSSPPTYTQQTVSSTLETSELRPKSELPMGMDLSLVPKQFVVLDLETTGLSPETDEIIEIGAIRFDRDSKTHPFFQSLIKPTERVPNKITHITGITQAMVDNDGLSLSEGLAKFKEFVGDLPLVAFNAPFDMGFIWNAAKKHGIAINNRYTCALKLVRLAYPGLPSYRLADLAKMGNLSDENTHRALGDCERTAPIFTSSVMKIGERVFWDVPPVDWRVSVAPLLRRRAHSKRQILN